MKFEPIKTYTKTDIENLKNLNDFKVLVIYTEKDTEKPNDKKINDLVNYYNHYYNHHYENTFNEFFYGILINDFHGFSKIKVLEIIISMQTDINNLNNFKEPLNDKFIINLFKNISSEYYNKLTQIKGIPFEEYLLNNIFENAEDLNDTEDYEYIKFINHINIFNSLLINKHLKNLNYESVLVDKIATAQNSKYINHIDKMFNLILKYNNTSFIVKVKNLIENQNFENKDKYLNIINKELPISINKNKSIYSKLKTSIYNFFNESIYDNKNNTELNNTKDNNLVMIKENEFQNLLELKEENLKLQENSIYFNICFNLKQIDKFLGFNNKHLVNTLNIRENILFIMTEYHDQLIKDKTTDEYNLVFSYLPKQIEELFNNIDKLSKNSSSMIKAKGISLTENILVDLDSKITNIKENFNSIEENSLLKNLKIQKKTI